MPKNNITPLQSTPENTIKHLEFIQNIITRMNKNSFQLKGWNITILSAFLALYASSHNTIYILVALLPIIIFWSLDSYYLQQERKFRGLYNDIVNNTSDIKLFEMSVNKYTNGKYSFFSCLTSKTILTFYGSIFILLIVINILLNYKNICLTTISLL